MTKASRAALVFLHIPKTGGTSLVHSLAANFAEDLRFTDRGNISAELLDRIGDRLKDRCFVYGHAHHAVLDRLENACLTTVLRRPEDQAVSNYLYLQRSPETPLHRAACEMEFSDFMRVHWQFLVFQSISLDVPISITPIGNREMFFRRVPAVHALLERIDYVGRLEELDGYLASLASAFGWQTVPSAPRLNTASDAGMGAAVAADLGRAYRDLWNDRSLARLLAAEQDLYLAACQLSTRAV